MANCQKCGAESAPDARVCTQCGQRLTHAGAPLAQTMLGMVSPFAPQASDSSPTVSAPPATAPAPSPFSNKGKLSGTMIGMPSPVLTGQGSPDLLAAPANAAPGQLPHEASSQSKFKGTLLGIAQPGIAPRDPRAEPAPAPPRSTLTVGTPVAPWHKSSEAPQTPESEPVAAVVSQNAIPPAGAVPSESTRPSSQTYSAPPSSSLAPPPRPIWQNALLVGLGLLAAGSIGALAASLGEKPVQIVVTQYTFNEEGRDQLNLMCPRCPDGTLLSLDGSQAIVRQDNAVLLTERTLKVGHNELRFNVKNPQGKSLETRPVLLPIAYRQKANWTGRHDPSPYAEIVIEAPSGSEVNIDGKPAPLRGTTATARIDLSDRTLGESTTSEELVLAIPMNVTVDGKKREAQATLRSNVTPLQLTSIALVHELGGKPLAIRGRTSPGASVLIGDAKLQADDDGSFGLVIPKPSPGKLIVTSFTERLVARRVEILLVARAVVAGESVSSFADLKDGVAAQIDATVLESRVLDGVTMMLLEMQSGCRQGPCLVRGVYAEPRSLRPNQSVRISGRIQAGEPMSVRISKFL